LHVVFAQSLVNEAIQVVRHPLLRNLRSFQG